jgi:DNA-directed RNA polymerase subunit N (RpoN/RPB10)
LIDKWGREDWWKNFERIDLTEEQAKELDELGMYDQLLNTVGRGVQCNDCAKKEAELYDKYYPRN